MALDLMLGGELKRWGTSILPDRGMIWGTYQRSIGMESIGVRKFCKVVVGKLFDWILIDRKVVVGKLFDWILMDLSIFLNFR